MATRYLKLIIAYNGARYCGWQLQVNGPTIQGEIEAAYQRLTGETSRATASGRTDAGVHALGQVVRLETTRPYSLSRFESGLNRFLPRDIRVLNVSECDEQFDPIRHAKWKTYRYHIQEGPILDVFQQDFAWFIPDRLNLSAMQAAAQLLVGTHDFRAFQSHGSPRASTIRHIRHLTVEYLPTDPAYPLPIIRIEIEANGYLYNMVRNIAGTLALIGRGKHPPTWAEEVLASLDRRRAGPTAPPQGLFLVKVDYRSEC